MAEAADFEVHDAGGGHLQMRGAKQPGAAFLAAWTGAGRPAFVFLRADDARGLRDWLNALLERHAAHLPVQLDGPE